MGIREYLLSQIPPEVAKKWKLDECLTEPTVTKEEVKDRKFPINFRLPITYLDPSELHSLSPIVAQDLELTIPGSEKSIYDHLFKPTSLFGRNMIPAWTEYYTTNTDFLEDTQYLIAKVQQMPNSWCTYSPKYEGFNGVINQVKGGVAGEPQVPCPTYEKFSNIWYELKEDAFFLEKYGYLEWSMRQHFTNDT